MEKTHALLTPLFEDSGTEMTPASVDAIALFAERARARSVPEGAIRELSRFYRVTNGVPCLDGFEFHECGDDILYEWWDDERSLWLGSRDDDVLRWSDGKFRLGDAGNIRFDENHEFGTLTELLEFAFGEWYPDGADDQKEEN
ncbi:MAG: hypothetical protein LBI87_02580 [Candidatus Accumulibacter sp.]|jgi:hypothetical protein|nr:hypothetical protein [Accumulibacter sp.]